MILTSTSCGSPQHEPGLARDSAGVRILQFPSSEEEWQLADSPFVRIGEAEGDSAHELFNVKNAVMTEDGRIILANSGTQEIRVFDGSGQFLQSIGGAGGGPGEFRSLDWVDWDEGGRIVALDLDLRRITIFSSDGDVLSTSDVRSGPGYLEEGDLVLPDGHLLLRRLQSDISPQLSEGVLHPGQVLTYPLVLARFNPESHAMDTLVFTDGGDIAVWESGSGGVAFGGPWMGRLTTYGVGDDGIYVGTQQTFEILRFDFTGDLREIFRGPETDLTITKGLVASFENTLLGMASPRVRDHPEVRQRALEELRERPVATSKPAYGRILVGPGRRLWVSEWTFRRVLPRVWTVVDLDTGDAAKLTVPEGFYVFQVGEDFVLGKMTDELGVESVLLYEFGPE